MIETNTELYEALEAFGDMLFFDRGIERMRAEQMGDPKAVAKLTLLNNLIEEYREIRKFALDKLPIV